MSKSIWLKSSPEHIKVLFAVLMLANHEKNEWEWKGEKYSCEPGQLITSLESLRKACGVGVTTQNIRSALVRFEKLGFLTNESTKTGRLITIVNWAKYQGDSFVTNIAPNKEVTKSQQSTNKEVTTNKNVKNDKNVRSVCRACAREETQHTQPPSFSEVSFEVHRAGYKMSVDSINRFIEYNEKRGCEMDWKTALERWAAREPEKKSSAGKFGNFPQRDDQEHKNLVAQVIAKQKGET